MSYTRRFTAHQIGSATTPEGSQRHYRFPNDFGVSVIRHEVGPHAGRWELAILQWVDDECRPAATIPGTDQTPVFYYETPEGVADHMQVIADSPDPTGIEVDMLIPNPS